MVTLHVLLHKREVTSSAAWIGLAWFAPVTGAVFYALFGINRVQRRARRLRAADRRRPVSTTATPGTDDHLHPLQRGVGRITGRPLLGGNSVEMFENGDAAYPPMLEAIANAQRSLGLTSYIFRNDQWGGKFIDALIAAHQRGVAVRVLIDGIGGGWLLSPAYHRLRRGGVPAQRFLHSPLPWRMPFLNLRCHRKILVADGTLAFTGGMNIADENVMATHPKAPVQDFHFCLRGPIVCELTEAFAQDWAFVANENLDGLAWFPDLPDGTGAPARVIDSGPDEDIEKVEFAILQAVASARQSVAVMTPYFLPDERLIGALSMAAMRGVAVDVIVPAHNNHMLVEFAMRANSGPLLRDGVRLWRGKPPFAHTKMMVVDNEWCLIGSANWDIRSFRLNFELCVELYDEGLARALSAEMEKNRCVAVTRAEIDGRSTLVRLRDASIRLLMPYL
jgi:cardiolipin synthase